MRAMLALALVALAAVLAGCGSSSSSGNGVASKSADEILAATKAAAGTASSVHVSGTLKSSGSPISLNLDLVAGKGGKGQLSENGIAFELIAVDKTIYIKGSPAFYERFGGSAAAQLFQGKWLKAPAGSGELGSLSEITDLQRLLGQALASTGKLVKGSTTTINGQPAIELTDANKGGGLFVATTGSPYPVQIVKRGGETGTVTFSKWNESVTLTPPANAIDITQLQKLG